LKIPSSGKNIFGLIVEARRLQLTLIGSYRFGSECAGMRLLFAQPEPRKKELRLMEDNHYDAA
jgi:hypothetical protein